MPQPIPYLAFDGNCADAMRFYAKVLGGKLDMLTFGQSPMPNRPRKARGIRSCMRDWRWMKTAPCMRATARRTCLTKVSMAFRSRSTMTLSQKADQVFNALADGGKVTMPIGPTFWAKRFGMVNRPVRLPWIVNGEMMDVPMQG